MSKPAPTLYAVLIAPVLCLQIFTNVPGQVFDAKIEIGQGSRATVTGRFIRTDELKSPRNFSFEGQVQGMYHPAARITNLALLDSTGQNINFRKLIDGEYLADREVAAWRFEMDLAPLKDRSASAHASWISGERGLLMAADMLPVNARSGKIQFDLPTGWELHGPSSDGGDVRQGVFAIGNGWDRSTASASGPALLIHGKWHFTSAEAAEMAEEIYLSHRDLFRDDVANSRVIVTNFPVATLPGNWDAETRGKTIIIVSSDMPFRSQSLQRLHEQLRHEMFHLWIPNGVNLTGNYDWFYEGFALYRSLKLAVGSNRIAFEHFLDTLSRAHTIDSAVSQRVSLVQASAARFAGSNTQVYARGMLVAFLCDLALMRRTNGKRSVETILRDLYARHRKPAAPADGNTVILALMRSNPDLVPIADRYITGVDKIEWTAELAAAGIKDEDAGPVTALRVLQKPSGRQKALLDKLGYNNWRRLTPKSK
jgi:hypothetical protein